MLEQFAATLEQLYAAAADGSLWPGALSSIEQLTSSAGAVVHVISRDRDASLTNILGPAAEEHFPQDDVEQWTAELAPSCPRLAAAAKWPDAPYVVDHMILTERDMDFDPVYNWYRAHGLRYFIGSTLFRNSSKEAVWSLQRTPGQGHVQAHDVQLFGLLKPHLANAVYLAEQLDTLRATTRFSLAVLEALPQAVFALDATGKILFANARAATILEISDGLTCVEGRLIAKLPREQTRLDRALRDASIDPPTSSSWARVSRVNGGPGYAIFVAPLNAGDAQFMAADARVLAVVHDMGEHRAADIVMLVGLYGLTDAEARLASALSAGHSLESAAAELRIQPATARSQLKSVFRKTGVNRQQDLVRVLTSLSSVR